MSHTKTGPDRRTSITVVALILSLNLGYLIYTQSSGAARSNAHPKYGDRFPDIRLNDIDGRSIDWKSKWLLIIYFNHANPESVRLAKYAAILRDRYKDKNVVVLGITSGDAHAIRSSLRDSNLNYPVSTQNVSTVTFEKHDSWVLVVDPEGTIKFSSDFVRPNDMRMLLERYVVGRITYDTSTATTKLRPGDSIPDVATVPIGRDASQGEHLTVNHFTGPVIVFSARCSACSLASALEAYAAWEATAIPTSSRPTLLFSTKFTRRELEAELAKYEIKAIRRQALEPIPGIEDPYSLDGLFGSDVVVLGTSQDTTVARVESWTDFKTRTSTGKVAEP